MNRKGFTLIELLGVIVVLGILVLVSTMAIIPQMNKAKKQSFITEVNTFLGAAESYFKLSPDKSCVTVDELKNDGWVSIRSKSNEYSGVISKIDDYYQVNISKTNNGGSSGYYISFKSTQMAKLDYKTICESENGCDNYREVFGNTWNFNINCESQQSVGRTTYRLTYGEYPIGEIVSNYISDVSDITEPFFVKHTLDQDDKIIDAYACLKFNNSVTCVQYGAENYEANKTILSNDNCEFTDYGDYADCYYDNYSYYISVSPDGSVSSSGPNGSCDVQSNGTSECGGF